MLMTPDLALHLPGCYQRLWAAHSSIHSFFGAIEAMFFFSSLTSSSTATLPFMATAIFVVMFVWRRGTAGIGVYLPVDKYIDQLRSLSHVRSIQLR